MDKSGQVRSDQPAPQQGTETTTVQQQGQSRRGKTPQAGEVHDRPTQMGGSTTTFTDWASI
jgi:hypothetical protein